MVTFMPLQLYLRAKNPGYPFDTGLVSNIIKLADTCSPLFMNNEALKIKFLLMVCLPTLSASQNIWRPVFG
jgi:hypothetical protein